MRKVSIAQITLEKDVSRFPWYSIHVRKAIRRADQSLGKLSRHFNVVSIFAVGQSHEI